MPKRSCFFATMQSFFSNNSRTSRTTAPKAKKQKKNSDTNKALEMYWRRKLHSRSNKAESNTRNIPKVIDLTEDEVIAPIELKLFDEQRNEIPILIQVKRDIDLPENIFKLPEYSDNSAQNTSELHNMEISCTENSFIKQIDSLNKNEAVTLQSVHDSKLVDQAVTLELNSDDEIIEVEEVSVASDSELESKLHEMKDIVLDEMGCVVNKEPVVLVRTGVVDRDFDVLDQKEVEIGPQKAAKPERKKRKKVKIGHMFTENEDGMFRCDLCEEMFATKKCIQYHLFKHKRPSSTEYKCSICGKWFPWRKVLVHHLKTHLISSNITENMNDMFGNNSTIVAELKKFEEAELKDVSKFDNEVFNDLEKKLESSMNLTSSSLVKLISDTENEIVNLACGYCDQCFRTQSALVDHCRVHMANLPFMCNICGSLFKQKASLVYHSRIHYRMIRRLKKKSSAPFIKYILRVYSCRDCDRSYVSWTALNQHKITAHGVPMEIKDGPAKKKSNPKKCTVVDDLAQIPQPSEDANESLIEESVDVLNVNPETNEIFSCNKCTETFASTNLLETHCQNKHTAMYECCHCYRTYRRKRSYEKHLKIHNKSRLLACSFCEKSFAELPALKEHILTHMQGAWVCKCSRTFLNKHAFVRHHVTHVESKQNSCDECGHLFNPDVDPEK